jgi:hypothetical protein
LVTLSATHDSIPAGRSIKTQRQPTAPKEARAEVGLGGVGVEKGRRRHQPAGTLDPDPVDVDAGLLAQ